jgi:hypothetical protein
MLRREGHNEPANLVLNTSDGFDGLPLWVRKGPIGFFEAGNVRTSVAAAYCDQQTRPSQIA